MTAEYRPRCVVVEKGGKYKIESVIDDKTRWPEAFVNGLVFNTEKEAHDIIESVWAMPDGTFSESVFNLRRAAKALSNAIKEVFRLPSQTERAYQAVYKLFKKEKP